MLEKCGIGVEEGELRHFQEIFPSSRAANLLNRLLVKYSQMNMAMLVDPKSSLEQLRFAQGANEVMGLLIRDVQTLVESSWDDLEEEAKLRSEEEAIEEAEARPVMDF